MFALVDCNNFYASCERVFKPELNGKPIVVLSNNDGNVIARSKEAKALGVEMTAPLFKIKSFLEKNHIHIFSSNYALYGDLSERVMNTLAEFVPRIEVYSIDEAFLDFSGFIYKDLATLNQQIRQSVKQNVGIPVSIGVAPTKTLAKIANHVAKQQFPEKGVFVANDAQTIEQMLQVFPVDRVWGIGRNHTKFLQKRGIESAWQLAQASDSFVQKNMTVIGLRTVKELRGESCLQMEDVTPPRKGIITSRSFAKTTDDLNLLKEYIATYASRAAEKLRLQNSCTTLVHVSLRTNRFNRNAPQYSKSCSIQLPTGSNDSSEVVRYAHRALEKIYLPNYQYKKAQVSLTGLIPKQEVQNDLFSYKAPQEQEKQEKLMQMLDKVNTKLGRDKVKLAALGSDKWKSHAQYMSPRYTTRWEDILKVKV